MRNLIYKEFKLSISRVFFLIVLFGALLLIRNWFYFIALMYVMFIAMPNIFITARAQSDIGFSVMLPVKKRDVVKSRVLAIMLLELSCILVAAIFAVVNIIMYGGNNYFLDPNFAFFGLVFVMYAIFNVIFLPGFYKTAHKVGIPAIIANIAIVLFAAAVEYVNIVVPSVGSYIDGINNLAAQLPVLAGGIVVFALGSFIAYKISAKRFEKVEL